MSKTINYYFTVTSPWSYLGDVRLRAIAGRHGWRINHKPVDMGEVFAVSGGLPLAKRPPQRVAYRMMELKRWRARLGGPLTLEPKFFPAADTMARRVILAAQHDGLDAQRLGDLVHAFMRVVWVDEKNIAETATLAAVLDGMGLDGAHLLARADTAEIDAAARANTEQAKSLGVFGAPTYVIGDELFWGQDRLDFVEEKVSAQDHG
ncbi:MAG: 2-hydroxychromene-2-carboxylate isomerase [Rhodospirillales bacterium]